ncbi:GtrA family protein [Mesorhizobium australicum]|uniref:Putative flippase GtrA (Transmembrane translocase of bactoprenol-linked glucose) n=1 Tax=Mesorhizobium australicum TaxID=536018 RepID=A0A1X7N2X9_9HYPH|nr:GtrA family protein [Mesorhizobium australicum]SMH31685.1 Putative flippase GtrA (transmembrane translocase of bactoprenol-linked glucose) [Mesorhizobium australicum]
MRRFGRFLVIGVIGFVADAGMLGALLMWTPLGVYSARLVSIAFALAVTWLLNRLITFGPSSRPVAVEGARYGGVGIATSAINYLAYSAFLWAMPDVPIIVALVVASVVALAFSFAGYSRLVFDR